VTERTLKKQNKPGPDRSRRPPCIFDICDLCLGVRLPGEGPSIAVLCSVASRVARGTFNHLILSRSRRPQAHAPGSKLK